MERDAADRKSVTDRPIRRVDEGAEEPWKQEIESRRKEIDSGAVELIPWSFARRRLRDRLNG